MRLSALACGIAASFALNPALAQEPEPITGQDITEPTMEAAPAEPAPEAAAPSEPVVVEETETSVVTEQTTTRSFGAQHYLGVMGTYTDPDKDRSINGADVDYAAGFSVLYGWQSEDQWGFEIQGFNETFETGDPARTDWYRYGLNVDLFYAFGDRTSFTPFVLIGAGANYDDVYPAEDKTTWFANAGVGFVTAPFTRIGDLRLRGEARYIHDDFESGYGDIRYALGIEIPLFAERDAAVAEIERDARVVALIDGLADSDGDGVIDEKDQCPGTPTGTRVTGEGCPLPKIMELKGVTFEFDGTRLRPDAQTILDGASDVLLRYPDMKVEIAGHTDSVGSEAYNQNLSEGRAASVREYFIGKGVPDGQMTSKGYGESQPLVDNATAEGRERNRRVELRIQN